MTTTETQDIVERLRHSANVLGNYDSEWTPDVATMRAAAAEIERLRSLTEWRPIETAPRDGTRLWGKVGDDAIAMLWHDKFQAFVSSWRRMTMAPGYQYREKDSKEWVAEHDHSPDVHHPTHWLPLPPPPGDTHGQKTPQSPEPLRKDSCSAVDDPPW